jgi:hypothetical protein
MCVRRWSSVVVSLWPLGDLGLMAVRVTVAGMGSALVLGVGNSSALSVEFLNVQLGFGCRSTVSRNGGGSMQTAHIHSVRFGPGHLLIS